MLGMLTFASQRPAWLASIAAFTSAPNPAIACAKLSTVGANADGYRTAIPTVSARLIAFEQPWFGKGVVSARLENNNSGTAIAASRQCRERIRFELLLVDLFDHLGDFQHVGIFDREEARNGISLIADAAEATPHHLLAKELRAEGPNAEHMGYGVSIPAFGEHGDADDALDVLAKLPRLADRVEHFAEQVFVGKLLGVAAGEAGAVFGLELFDF